VTLGTWLVAAWAVAAPGQVFLKLERINPCGYWRVVLDASGEATGELFNSCHPVAPKRVSLQRAVAAHLPSIKQEIERARFTELPERIEGDDAVLDDDACSIEITGSHGSKRVILTGVQLKSRDRTLQGFRRVWKAVDRLVPEPAW
jgi:hypothetical protein